MKLGELLKAVQKELSAFKCAPFEARQLIQTALGLDATKLITSLDMEISEDHTVKVQSWSKRRSNGEPLAYLSGSKGFYKSEFLVEPGVLIPRPETEIIVEKALELKDISVVADFGCGSGCIGLSIIRELPRAKLYALDSSAKAVEVTGKNAAELGLSSRVSLEHLAVEHWQAPEALDLVVANPPYIAPGDVQVEKAVHDFEPHEALYSGANGLDAVRTWSAKAFAALKPGGTFICEFGAGQTTQIQEIITHTGFTRIEIIRDLAGIERTVSAIKT